MDSNEDAKAGNEMSEQDYRDAGTWSTMTDARHYESLGFLQLCIERRFHQAVQEKFQEVTGLESTQYWIHSDVAGTPQMEDQRRAPDYCRDQGVKFMGWSAHGTGCGGYVPGTPDSRILGDLMQALNKKPELYPRITHYGFFATQGATPEEVSVCVIPVDPKPQPK